MLYTLVVQIADADLKVLINGGYNLCVIKDAEYEKQEVRGNAVFLDALPEHLAPELVFRWEDRYQTYMTEIFEPMIPAERSTKVYDISLGQMADFDKYGNAEIKSGSTDVITVVNSWKNGGRAAIATYDPTTREFPTTYISPPMPSPWATYFVPTGKIGVFFHGKYKVNLDVDTNEIPVYQVDYRDKTSMTVRYENGGWRTL